jgi:hypothetical protein
MEEKRGIYINTVSLSIASKKKAWEGRESQRRELRGRDNGFNL